MNEELNNIAKKAEELGAEAADKAQELLDKTDIDEKIVEGAKGVIGKIGSLFGKGKE